MSERKLNHKKCYISPTLFSLTVEMENGIAAESTARVGIDPTTNNIRVEDWKTGDNFEETDFSLL